MSLFLVQVWVKYDNRQNHYFVLLYFIQSHRYLLIHHRCFTSGENWGESRRNAKSKLSSLGTVEEVTSAGSIIEAVMDWETTVRTIERINVFTRDGQREGGVAKYLEQGSEWMTIIIRDWKIVNMKQSGRGCDWEKGRHVCPIHV